MKIKEAWKTLWDSPTQPQPTPQVQPTTQMKSYSLTQVIGLGDALWTEANYQNLAREAYYKNLVAYKCIAMTAQAVGSLNWVLYNEKGDEIEKHPVLDLLRKPNPSQATQSFISNIVSHKGLAGNAYIHAVRPSTGRAPRELYALRPDRMTINRGIHRLPLSYSYNASDSGAGQSMLFPVDQITGKCDVLHLRTFNPLDDFSGMAALQPAARSVDVFNEGQEWNKKLLQNGARPGGALTTEDMLTEEQVNLLYDKIDDRFSGSANAGKPMVLAGGLKWQEMALTPKDVEYLQGKHSAARDIALALGVPPILLHLPGDSTYNNVVEARLAYYEDTVLPEATYIATELSRWLLPMFGEGLMLTFDEDAIVALAPRRQQKWQMVTQSDFLTINEKREALGYEPVEGGDDLLVSSALLPLGEEIDDTEVMPEDDEQEAEVESEETDDEQQQEE
jgi:HK97 family phage portal protein